MVKKEGRLEYLDSLRGVAAISVMIFHFIGWKWEKSHTFHFASMIFNGSDAVSFFFVLSGFVLSYGLYRSPSVNLKHYTIKRILRLYPAYIITVFMNFMYFNRHSFHLDKLKNFSFPKFFQEAMLIRGFHQFYIPGWTLEIEMALSMLVPIFVIVILKDIKYVIFTMLLGFIAGGYISPFMFHFLLGICLSYLFYSEKIDAINLKIRPYYWIIIPIVFLMFSIRHIERIHVFPAVYYEIVGYLHIDFFSITAFASFVFLFLVLANLTSFHFLHHQVLLFFGKISYSIYLTHWLVVVYVMEHWEKYISLFSNFYLGFIVLLILSFIATILLSTIMYYAVEVPFINLSKSITKKK